MTKRKPKMSRRDTLEPNTVPLLVAVVLCCTLARAAGHLNYSEVVGSLGSGCPRLDSCEYQRSNGGRGRQLASMKERNCACDYLCPEYGDCCVDAPFAVAESTADASPGARTKMKCVELKQFGGVYMRDSCPATFRGPPEVKRLCEDSDPDDLSDPLGSMPVTDSLSGVTYKNHFCSLCHDKADNIVLWTPRLECPLLTLFNSSKTVITDDYVVQNLATDGKGAWGLFLENGENGSLFFHDCSVDPVMPLHLEGKIRLCKPNLVWQCPGSWRNDVTRELCGRYMGVRYVHGEQDGYRNVHCALCNGVNVTHLSCQSAELRGIDIFRQFATHSFALLLDINEKRGQQVGKVRICESGEVFDPFFKKCRSLTCLPGYVRVGRKCQPRQEEENKQSSSTTEQPFISILSEITNRSKSNNNNVTYEHTAAVDSIPDLNLSSGKSYNVSDGKFLDCLLISLADEDYVMLPNRTLFVPKYDRLYEPTSYYAADGSVLVCTHFAPSDHEAKFLPVLGYVTIVGLGVSMLFLVLHFAVFCVVPDLQNLSGKNLVSQCFALFFAYLCFICGQSESLGGASCALVAFLTFYFFQVSFFWMAAMAYDVWRTLKMATTELRVTSGRQTKRFLVYSFFSWTTPCFILILLAFAEYTDLFSPGYRPGFTGPAPCWFKRRRSLLVFFASPLLAIMLANVVLFVASSRMIVMTTVSQQSRTQQRDFKLYLRLALLMGLTWVVGLVAGTVDAPFLFYLFVVLNTLQGLFIFVAFSCSSKVFSHLRNTFRLNPRPAEFKSSGNSASSAAGSFSTKPTTLMIRNSNQEK